MKLYNGMSPNGARVDIFLAEKEIDLPRQQTEVVKGDTRKQAFLKINPLGQIPVLELDDGFHLTETLAICRYLEHLYPEPALFGKMPQEQAIIEMWTRRMELRMFNVVGDIFLHEFEMFKDVVEQNPTYAAARRRLFNDRLHWLDEALSDARPFIAGEAFSIADIVGMSMLFMIGFGGIEIPNALTHAKRWERAMKARTSFPALQQAA